MTTGDISTVELIWGSVWRASLYGVILGAGFGGFYAAALGTIFVFPIVGTVLGFFFGAFAGALLGFPLGLLDGLLLSWLVAGHRSVGHPNPRPLRLQGGILCVMGSVLLADWTLHGLPDPDGFAVSRAYLLGFELIFPTKYLQTGVPLEVFGLSARVFVPTLMVLVASWLTGRRVATWYVGEVTEEIRSAVRVRSSALYSYPFRYAPDAHIIEKHSLSSAAGDAVATMKESLSDIGESGKRSAR